MAATALTDRYGGEPSLRAVGAQDHGQYHDLSTETNTCPKRKVPNRQLIERYFDLLMKKELAADWTKLMLVAACWPAIGPSVQLPDSKLRLDQLS
jgi:hypothetical protein